LFDGFSAEYDAEKEAAMIELTKQQAQAIAASGVTPPVLVDPTSKATYVLLRQEEYEKIIGEEYDDSEWTDEEMDLLAWEAGKLAGWEDMDEYDHDQEKP
jgi:hypothetical protein